MFKRFAVPIGGLIKLLLKNPPGAYAARLLTRMNTMTENKKQEMDALWQDFRKRVRRRKTGRISGYALLAVVLMAFPASLLFYHSPKELVEEPRVFAEVGQFLLNDGTKVTLTGGSRIIYPETFENDVRRVQMEGAAYFEVESSPERPFIIDAAGGYIKVTGTKFMATAVSDTRVRVSLDEGRIELGSEGHAPVLVYPSEEVEYDTATGKVVQTMLTFMDDRLETILDELGTIYGFSVKFESEEVKDMRLLFRIPKYRDAGKVLNLIENVCDAQLRFADGIVTVSSL